MTTAAKPATAAEPTTPAEPDIAGEAASSARTIARQAMADLAPFPGRGGMMWRIALLCAIVAAVAALYKTPEAGISCYLVIFVMKRDAAESIAMALGIIVLVSIVVFFVIFLAAITIESPLLRMLTIAAVSFVFLFLQGASKLGPVGGVIALVIAFTLTLVSDAPVGEVVTRGMLYAWQMAAMPMMLMVVFCLLVGRSPVSLLRERLRDRLVLCEAALREPGRDWRAAFGERLGEGNAEALKSAGLAKLFHLLPAAGLQQIARDVPASFRLLAAVGALLPEAGEADRLALADHIGDAIAALDASEAMPEPPARHSGARGPLGEAWQALAVMAGAEPPPAVAGEKDGFFLPDAFTNPVYQRFALKGTAAAIICYIIYTGLDWQGIHTAMITCYVVSLGTTGETVHKLGLRIVGCLVGATMGILAIVFVMPFLDSVGGLMALVFFGCLLGGWIASGNERIAYAGVQVALAFLLCVLQGSGPATDMDAGRDRVIGVLLGNLVVYLIFTQIWPVSVEAAIRLRMGQALAHLAVIARLKPAERAGAAGRLASAEELLSGVGDALYLTPFEPARVRPAPEIRGRLETARREAEGLGRALYFAGEVPPAVADDLDALAQAVSGLPGAGPLPEPGAAARDEAGPSIGARLGRLGTALAGGV